MHLTDLQTNGFCCKPDVRPVPLTLLLPQNYVWQVDQWCHRELRGWFAALHCGVLLSTCLQIQYHWDVQLWKVWEKQVEAGCHRWISVACQARLSIVDVLLHHPVAQVQLWFILTIQMIPEIFYWGWNLFTKGEEMLLGVFSTWGKGSSCLKLHSEWSYLWILCVTLKSQTIM